ncbi:7751_t:CDS:2, partial [Scutellospora calospora]
VKLTIIEIMETISSNDIVDTGEDMSLVVKTSEDISFKDDCVVVDSGDTDFAVDSDEDISFAFDNSKDTSLTVDNNEDIANNESVNSTINPSNSDTSTDRNTTGTLATHLNSKHKKNISLKQQMLLCFATTLYTPKEEKRVNEINRKVEYLKPELDIDTCWNSTFLILQKFNRIKEILEYLVAKNKKQLEDLWLDESGWDQIDAILELLEPIYKATLLLSASSYPAISNVCLVFMGLLRHLDQYLSNHEMNECYMVQSIMHKLDEYWGIIEKSTVLLTLLNPHSKLMTFVTCEARSTAVSVLHEHMLSYGEAPSNTSTTKQRKENKKTNQRLFFESLLQEENAALVENDKMARDYLSIQGTSVQSERAFSIAAHTITKIRSNFSSNLARAVLCLKSWITKVHDDYYDYDKL